jgi:hypothetical protein
MNQQRPPGHTPGRDELPPHTAAPGYGQTPTGPPAVQTPVHPAELVQVRRDLFWQNVVREVLMGLASAAAAQTGRLNMGASAAATGPSPESEMFDGRTAVITTLGQRIPIADVVPVFACSSPTTPGERLISSDVQCTIFRIRTPAGENYTMPITNIAGIHSMSDALAEKVENAAREMEETDSEGNKMPFGFAAYTSLARAEARQNDRPEASERAADA